MLNGEGGHLHPAMYRSLRGDFFILPGAATESHLEHPDSGHIPIVSTRPGEIVQVTPNHDGRGEALLQTGDGQSSIVGTGTRISMVVPGTGGEVPPPFFETTV